MDKQTLSNYGWIVITVLILAVMLALATPFGEFIAGAFKSTYVGFGNVTDNAFTVVGIGGNGGSGETGGEQGGNEGTQTPDATTLSFSIYETQLVANEGLDACADNHELYIAKGMTTCKSCGQTIATRQNVAVATFEITEGQTFRQLIESGKYAELTLNTQLDADFNNVTFAAYNGSAIVLSNTPVALDTAIDTAGDYRLGSIDGPVKASSPMFYTFADTSSGSGTYTSLYYEFTETSETEGAYTIYNATITDSVIGDGMADGGVTHGEVVKTGTYTSAHGLYLDQTLTLDDGSIVAMGSDAIWGIQATDGSRIVIAVYFDAYEYLSSNPDDHDYIWAALN